jgi:hypothetical protein
MKYLLLIYLTGGILGATGLALAGAASIIATGIAVAVVALAAGAALALCIHVAGAARLAVERAKWEGRCAFVAAQRQASIPRQLHSPANITVDAVILTAGRNRIYN